MTLLYFEIIVIICNDFDYACWNAEAAVENVKLRSKAKHTQKHTHIHIGILN